MQDLRERLRQINVQDEESKQTIADAIVFIDKVAAYGAKQKAVFESLGYMPKGDQGNDR